MALEFITEGEMKDIVIKESERAKKLERVNILNPAGFSWHLISVGNKAYDISMRILDKHPDLAGEIDPYIARTTGYFHDFAKIGGNIRHPEQEGGDIWHDIEGPYMVLTRNREFGIVRGNAEESAGALRQIALGISSDFALAEEMGSDFPKSAAYRIPKGLIERVDFLMRNLSSDGNPISWKKLVYPDNLMRKIAQYSDMVDIGGGVKQAQERRREIIERYAKWADELSEKGEYEKANYFRHQIGISHSSTLLQRVHDSVLRIEQLMR